VTKTRDDGGPAFPYSHAATLRNDGMSLRDWFAGQALAAIGMWAPTENPTDWRDRDVVQSLRARWAYEQADAMLKARK
jgi:hypothetical protein